MKLNMIVGKKQIVLASLIVILGVAVYINWTFANDQGIAVNASSASDSSSDSNKNYGDAELVNADASNYFAQARLEKQTARDEAVATIAKILGDSSTSSDAVQQATDKAIKTAAAIENESRIETLIKSKGFQDCLVYLTDNNAKIVVKTDANGLDESKAAQIMDIVVTESGIPSENVSINEVK